MVIVVVLSQENYQVEVSENFKGDESIWLKRRGDWKWMALSKDHKYLKDLKGKTVRVTIEVVNDEI